jgi:ZIP family zinc transporter
VAITAHNFPEGLATFATLESPSVGMPLAFAIAIHNIPEGIAIAVPVYFATQNKFYAFSASLLSGLAEPWARRLATGFCQDRCRTPRSAGCSA